MGALSTYTTAAERRVDQAAWEAVSRPATTAGLHPVIADVLTRQLRIAASPCMCGATDCPACGPAQGYEVVRTWTPGAELAYAWINVWPSESGEKEDDDEEASE